MDKKHLDVFEQRLKEVKEQYLKIQNDKDNKDDKFEELKKIINKCNIIEEYNLAYLKSLKEFEDDKNFKSVLENYECSLSIETIDENFPKIINKIKAMDKIKLLIFSILELESLPKCFQEIKIKNIFDQIKSEKYYKLNCQLLPSDNMELYLYNLYQVFRISIVEKIKGFKINELDRYENEGDKIRDKNMLKEINMMIDEHNKIKNDKKKEKEQKELSIKISSKSDKLRIFQIVRNKHFQNYLKGFGQFYLKLNSYLDKYFFHNENFNENDIILFEQFIHALPNYEFQNLDYNYSEVWKESFEEIPLINKKELLNNLNNLRKGSLNAQLINNNMHMQIKSNGNIIIIKNIYKYSFNGLIGYLTYRGEIKGINDFELIKFLKIQYLSEFIHKTILNDKWKTFLYEVFNSKTIETLVNSVYSSAKNIDKKEYKKIIDSVKFFNFHCVNLGQSYPLYDIFICGIITRDETDPLEWIKYYLRLLIIYMHEILDHIIIFLIKVLYDKDIKSPETKGDKYSRTANKRGRESGEYLHVKLFGKLLKKLTRNELCFIFDIKNYSDNYKIFTANFSKCNNKQYETPEILKDLFNNLDLEKFNEIALDIYASKGVDEFTFNILDENERICKIIDIKEDEDFIPENLINDLNIN